MRKLTGYIGALIIVFALMGSILAGYALNVNGSSSVINEYERVTDVSGLYDHSQEPNYIDYNPASNYIGYKIPQFYENIGLPFKRMSPGETITFSLSNSTINYDNRTYSFPSGDNPLLSCTYGYVYSMPGTGLYWTSSNGDYGVNTINFTWTGTEIQVIDNVKTFTNNTGVAPFVYYPFDNYDSVKINPNTRVYYNPDTIATTGDKSILFNGGISPRLNGNNIYLSGTWGGMVIRGIPNGNNYIPDTQIWSFTDIIDVSYGVKSGIFAVTNGYGGSNLSLFWSFMPRYAYVTQTMGINYIESNRVNNYLMETTYTGGSTQTVTQTLNLTPGMGLTDYWGSGSALGQVPRMWRANSTTYEYNGTSSYVGMPTYTTQSTSGYTVNLRSYDLFDILSYYNISADKQITIKAYGTADYSLNNGESIGDNNFTKLSGSGFYSTPGFMDDKYYCIYNPNTQVFDYYDKNDVKTQTSNVCYVTFCGNSPRYGPITNYAGNILGYYDFGTRPAPHIDITYETQTGGTTTYHYSDITKGYSIKDDNVVNVIWNNEYNNGNIQILFRANDTIGTYHNDLIVGDNTISVDYTDGGYSITLNSGDRVAVGKWRAIILNMDLRTGELSAIPVRTFNSFTNVDMDTASIVIGDMVNPAPTNTIEWAPTSNSLMFNVYSTAVFMNTYGVVMVNPQLDITEYFTDLNGFYRMRLYNFSILGSSITVNGVTADVSNNSITINDQTVQIKDMAITYADGHAYISDSNVNIDLGEIVNYNISMSGAWYFETELLKGFTSQKMIYTWDWGDFILNNTQFCIMYIGIALVALMIARRYCSLSITDYIVLIVSFAIALTVQVVA